MPLLQLLRPTLPILIGASLMLSLSMGLRQSLGIFLQPLTHDVGISVSDFTLAIAMQNLAWGFLQPLAGALTVRYGFRAIMMVGALLYIAGLVLMASAQGLLSVMLGVGPLVAGAVAEMFGLQWQAMIQGLAFMSHQLGSFVGAYGGGLIYDTLGSYNLAWRIGVSVGLAAGIIQVAFALIRPTRPPLVATA
jgi:MFS family permease